MIAAKLMPYVAGAAGGVFLIMGGALWWQTNALGKERTAHELTTARLQVCGQSYRTEQGNRQRCDEALVSQAAAIIKIEADCRIKAREADGRAQGVLTRAPRVVDGAGPTVMNEWLESIP